MTLIRINRTLREFALRAGGLQLMRTMASRGIRILLYHRFPIDSRDNLALQCEHLRKHYHPVSLLGIDRWLFDGLSLPRNSLAVTVDDGHSDFFHTAYPVFRAYGIPVTMFLTTGFLDGACWLWTDQLAYAFRRSAVQRAEIPLPGCPVSVSLDSDPGRSKAVAMVKAAAKRMSQTERTLLVRETLPQILRVRLPARPPSEYEPLAWNQVREMARNGMFFGAHTQTHPILSSISSTDELRAEIHQSKARIEEELDCEIPHFSYPNGTSRDLDARTVEEVKAARFRCAVLAQRGINRRDTDPFLLYRTPVGPQTPPLRFGREVLRRKDIKERNGRG